MSVIMMLRAEHENLGILLDALERELHTLEHDGACNWELVSAVADYWRDYPQQCHHPKEDLLIAKLERRGFKAARGLHDFIEREHREVDKLNTLLARALQSSGTSGEGAPLGPTLRLFVDRNRRHMALEEEHLFPAAEQHLESDDWAELEFALLDRADPVFDRKTEARYHILLDAILAENRLSEASTRFQELRERIEDGQVGALERIADVESFNAVARNGLFGAPARLFGDEDSGYALERNGVTVAEIPRCDEATAAWCACYFLLGRFRG